MASRRDFASSPHFQTGAQIYGDSRSVPAMQAPFASESGGGGKFTARNFDAHWRIELKQPVSISLSSNEQIQAVREHGRLADCDDALARMLGYSSASDLLKNAQESFSLDCFFDDKILNEFVRSDYQLKEVLYESSISRKNQRHFSIDLFGIVKNGGLTQIWGVQRILASRIAESHPHQNVIDSMLEHIAIIDREGRIVATNDAWKRFAGKNCSPNSEESIGLGANYLNVCLCEGEEKSDGEKVFQGIKGVLENRSDYFTLEYPCHTPSGEERWFLLHVTPLAETGGAVISHLNITKRKNAERELARALDKLQLAYDEAKLSNRLKDEFLATVSHELRTPLTSILGWARLLRSQNLDEKTATHGLSTIERNAQAQSRLIDDLLDVSRIVSGSIKLDFQPFDLTSAAKRAIETLQPTAELKNIALEFQSEVDDAPVNADARRIEQIVWHLLSNAVKFTPQSGAVNVRLRKIDFDFEISVSDTGVGVKPEFLPHLFERFRQQDASTTRKHGGLGLGLTIVKHLTELHGGQISASSEGEGKGATFKITLPMMSNDSESNLKINFAQHKNLAVNLSLEKTSLSDVNLLIVDDDSDNLEYLKYLFENLGANVQAASSVKEALEKFYDKKPDLIISDIGMPHQDGFYLIQKIRETKAAGGDLIPAIALTAYAKTEDKFKALKSGFQRHLKKPADPSDLIQQVINLLGSKSD